jgi:hypothetical protein
VDSIERKRDVKARDGGSRSECIVQDDKYDNEHIEKKN